MIVSNIFLGIGFLFIFFFLSTGIGITIVKKNQNLSNNTFLILPMGFIVFFAITFAVYIPFVLLNINLFGLAIVELIKDFGILYYILYKIKPVAYLWLKKVKLFLLLIFLASLFLILQWFTFNPILPNEQMGFGGWIQFNKSGMTLQSFNWYDGNSVKNYGGKFFSETWYYFNLIVAFAFNLNINFLMFWIDGIMIYTFAFSIIVALFTIFIKDKIIVKYVSAFIVITLFTFISNYDAPAVVGFVGLTYLFIAALVFFIYFTKNNEKNLIYWCNYTLIAAWSFSSSAIFIFGVFYFSIFIYIVFTRKQDVFSTTLFMTLPISFVLGLYLYYSSIFTFFIFTILGTGVIALFIMWTRYWNNRQFSTIDNLIYRVRWISLLLPIFIIIGISITFLLDGKEGLWKNFDPYSGRDKLIIGSFSWGLWASYAVFLFILLLLAFFTIKKTRKFSNIYPLVFIGFICCIVFYNPLVSGFVHGFGLSQTTYNEIRINFFVPIIFIITIILMQQLKPKYLNMLFNLAMVGVVAAPIGLNINNISQNSFLNTTGGKGLEKVVDFVNLTKKHNPLEKFQLDGDLNGVRALTTIPFGPYNKGSDLYNKISGVKVNDSTFEKNEKLKSKNDNPWVFIKLKSLISNDFDYKKYGWVLKFEFDKYVVFLPFYPS